MEQRVDFSTHRFRGSSHVDSGNFKLVQKLAKRKKQARMDIIKKKKLRISKNGLRKIMAFDTCKNGGIFLYDDKCKYISPKKGEKF